MKKCFYNTPYNTPLAVRYTHYKDIFFTNRLTIQKCISTNFTLNYKLILCRNGASHLQLKLVFEIWSVQTSTRCVLSSFFKDKSEKKTKKKTQQFNLIAKSVNTIKKIRIF